MLENRARLAIVVPCYNEEEVIEMSNSVLVEKLKDLMDEGLISDDSYIYYVNDGSKDNTWNILEKLHERYSCVNCLKLSRNRGHQNAVMAGMMSAMDNCDCCITIDADLQDDVNVIRDMVINYLKGDQIVLGVRSKRDKDTFFKRFTAQTFYKIMNWMGAQTVQDHADFRLMSNLVLHELEKYNESNLFLRGVVMELGFSRSIVYFERKERLAGESKYPLSKMIGLAVDGITSFSIKPIKLVRSLGILFTILSMLAAVIFFILFLCNVAVSGWVAVLLAIFFMGGIQLISIGIIGEYVGKTYVESKHRPRYIVEKNLFH
jgi:glycosyltransferase involved in cell wall biosynthesis